VFLASDATGDNSGSVEVLTDSVSQLHQLLRRLCGEAVAILTTAFTLHLVSLEVLDVIPKILISARDRLRLGFLGRHTVSNRMLERLLSCDASNAVHFKSGIVLLESSDRCGGHLPIDAVDIADVVAEICKQTLDLFDCHWLFLL
jgi:hypothetical protein